MNCIDTHQHFWNYSAKTHAWITDDMVALKRDFLPSDLKPILEKHQIDGCIAVQADQSDTETAFLLELASKNKFILGVVGWIDLLATDVETQLEKYSQNNKLLGFRHVVQSEPNPEFILQDSFMRGIAALGKFNYTYDILIYHHQLKAANQLVEAFPYQKFILDHIAKPNIKDQEINQWKEDIETLAKNNNVFIKVSGMVTEANWKEWTEADMKPYLDVVFTSFGTERIMFGSDWPVCRVAANYTKIKNIFKNYISTYSRLEQEAMLYKNAINFYDIKL